MQAIAIEFNYSETTFVLPPKQPDHSAWVRIFTPISEVPFAGHPNVGTAFALAKEMAERNERVPGQFVFEEEAGLVPVTLLQENGAVIGAELLAPEPLSRRAQVTPESAAACLSSSSRARDGAGAEQDVDISQRGLRRRRSSPGADAPLAHSRLRSGTLPPSNDDERADHSRRVTRATTDHVSPKPHSAGSPGLPSFPAKVP